MSRRTTVFVLLSFLCGSVLGAQEWQSIGTTWTDKNNTENYAAYLISTAYAEHGYCGAKIEIKQSGAKRLFIVDPGEVFRLKEVDIIGPPEVQESKNAEDAPKPGDVYSQARLNDWVGKLDKQYAGANGSLKAMRRETTFDRDHALVTFRVTFQEQR